MEGNLQKREPLRRDVNWSGWLALINEQRISRNRMV